MTQELKTFLSNTLLTFCQSRRQRSGQLWIDTVTERAGGRTLGGSLRTRYMRRRAISRSAALSQRTFDLAGSSGGARKRGGQRGSLDTHARRGLDPPGTRAKPKTATNTVCGLEGRNRQTSSCSCGQRRWATDHQCIHDEETLPRLELAEVVGRKRGLHERHEDLRSLRKRCTPRARVVSVMLRRPRETAVDALGRTCRRLRSGSRARTACTRRR
jgi:hypothetical protein